MCSDSLLVLLPDATCGAGLQAACPTASAQWTRVFFLPVSKLTDVPSTEMRVFASF